MSLFVFRFSCHDAYIIDVLVLASGTNTSHSPRSNILKFISMILRKLVNV